MKYLIKNAKITQKGNEHNGKRMDILIEKGVIKKIQKDISSDNATIIRSKNLFVSEGWVDVGTHLGEPGYEHRETFSSLAKSAKAGGFTDLVVMPKAIPPTQSTGQIAQLKNQGKLNGINIHPIAALSADLKGENITEFVDLHHGGAVAFSDGLYTVDKGALLLRALQYAKSFDGMIIHHPDESSLGGENLIHEGTVSTSMGMKGSPSLAEELTVYRDIQLTKYAESQLTLHLLSTKEGVDAVRQAKKKDIPVFAGVSYLNLIKSDQDMVDFDTNLKVKPLLRSPSDQKQLRKGIKDGTLDYICSNHVPLEVEKKKLEYPYANHGAIGLETCFAGLMTFLRKDLDVAVIIEKLTTGPRTILSLESTPVKEGQKAKITCFDPTLDWQYAKDDIQSLSSNSPFIGQSFTGKVIATIC